MIQKFKAEYSYEAVTLDYLSPIWYPIGEPQDTWEAAEALRQEWRAARGEGGLLPVEPIASNVVPFSIKEQADIDLDIEASERYWADRAQVAREQEAAEVEFAKVIGKGRPVRVFKGRKVPIGTEGHVFWSGDKGWGMSVGIETPSGEKHFTSASNVESIEAVSAVAPAGVAA